jgi:FkbM family methyltransferase
MNSFKTDFEKKIIGSQFNNFGRENFDEYRFGKDVGPYLPKRDFGYRFKEAIKRYTGYKKKSILKSFFISNLQMEGLQKIYENLNEVDKKLLIDLVAFRFLGFNKIKLPRNNAWYWEQINIAKALADSTDTYDPKFLHFTLEKFNLNSIGYDVRLYFMYPGIVIDYLIEQYSYKINEKPIVKVNEGDVVFDIGACWGDTAFYFASKAGSTGKVFSFEFIPQNIKLFELNKSLNPNLASQIEIIPYPISDKSGQEIYFKDFGPGSKVVSHPFEGQSGSTTTLSIDDFVKSRNLTKVDFIKMDIEGAEPYALRGAIETIKTHRPTLAIAIYHSLEDFVNIPNWILNLNLDYEIFIDHFTIHEEETVCFAKPRNK